MDPSTPRAWVSWWIAIAATLVALSAGRAEAQEAHAPRSAELVELDAHLARIVTERRVPGASVVVIEDGEVVLSKGYGISDVRTKAPVTESTSFRAGSISKSITSIAVMLLVEEGKLRLDAPLRALAPEVRFDNPWESTDPVRLVHLLEHTSGFEDLRFRQYLIDGAGMPLSRAIELYGPHRSRWRPGTYWAYDNAGPVIAGYVLEKITGESFAELTRTRIFEPLGMASARWEPPADGATLSRSYLGDDLHEVPYEDIPGKPAGALVVTAVDLGKLVKMLIGRGAFNGGRLLSPESVTRMETPQSSVAARDGLTNGYGLGSIATVTPRSVMHGHNGAIDGFYSEYRYDAARRAGAIVMLNAGPPAALTETMDAITSYLERAWPDPPAMVPASVSHEELERHAGWYVATGYAQSWEGGIVLKLPVHVTVSGDALLIAGERKTAASPALFADAGSFTATRVFADTDEGHCLLKPIGALRRVSLPFVVARVGLWYALTPIALLGTIFAVPIWLVGAVRRKIRGFEAWSVRLVPALAMASAPALILTFVTAVSVPDPNPTLGAVTATSVAVFVLSCLLPASSVAALATMVRYGRGARASVRALGWINAFAALGASAHFLLQGWVALRTWTL